MSDHAILCEDLWHVYPGDIIALQNANLAVHSGEILGVVGQNGSGKTTLVKHFNGLLKPTRGRVFIAGQDSSKQQVHDLARHAGYVFQNPNHQLFATTVAAELAFGPKNFGLSEQEVQERVDDAVEFFGIEPLLEQHPYRLSFPMRKMIAMASIYAMQPSVFVLDEPTTGQDHGGANMVRRLVRRLSEMGRTVIIVSHDMALIAEVADRVVALWSSEIIGLGTPREIFADDAIMERTKLNPPQITQFSRRWNGNGLHAPSARLALTVEEAAQDIIDSVEK